MASGIETPSTVPRRTTGTESPRAAAEAAIEICRAGDWSRGLTILADLVKERGLSEHVPGQSPTRSWATASRATRGR
jgi:hypothetical protein